MQGWAIDPDTTAPLTVHVYVDGVWAGQSTAGVARPDVGNAYPGFGSGHGFDVTLPGGPVPPGSACTPSTSARAT